MGKSAYQFMLILCENVVVSIRQILLRISLSINQSCWFENEFLILPISFHVLRLWVVVLGITDSYEGDVLCTQSLGLCDWCHKNIRNDPLTEVCNEIKSFIRWRSLSSFLGTTNANHHTIKKRDEHTDATHFPPSCICSFPVVLESFLIINSYFSKSLCIIYPNLAFLS